MTTEEPVVMYFTFRSPFAYLALHRLMRSPQFSGVHVELRPMDPADLVSPPADFLALSHSQLCNCAAR